MICDALRRIFSRNANTISCKCLNDWKEEDGRFVDISDFEEPLMQYFFTHSFMCANDLRLSVGDGYFLEIRKYGIYISYI